MKNYSNNFLILFDQYNFSNYKFFSSERIKSKIKKNDIFVSKRLKDIKKFKNIILIGFTRKIKLDKNKNYFTVHESHLPKGRGHSPIKWQIINGKNNITCTLFKLNDQIDAGDIYIQKKMKLLKTDLYDEIKKKQMKITEDLIINLINKKNIKIKKQIGKPSYYPRLTEKEDGINPRKSILSQFDILRSTNPKYKNYFYINKQKFIIKVMKG